MKITNLFLAAISIFMVLFSGCGTSGNSNSGNANIANAANQSKVKRDVKPADFTITAEELSKVFAKTKEGVQSEDYYNRTTEMNSKFDGKTVAVTGKIWEIWRKNRGVSKDNEVYLYPDLELIVKEKFSGYQAIKCKFPDGDGKEIEPLKSGDTVTLQGLYHRYPDLPYFDNCVVVEIK